MRMRTLTTVAELVEALGGATSVARWAGYEDERGVYNWSSRGIPTAYHMRLVLEATRRGCVIDASAVFGMEDEDAETLRALSGAAFAASRSTDAHA